MALLTDTDLEQLICRDAVWRDRNTLHIYPYSEESLTPVGYDLRIGGSYSSTLKVGVFELSEGDSLSIGAGDTVLISTLENIGMPQDRTLSALIVSKVSQVSAGLSHIATTIDPDWSGNLAIAVHNHARRPSACGTESRFALWCFLLTSHQLHATAAKCQDARTFSCAG